MSQVVSGGRHIEIAGRRVGKTVCWVIVLIVWLAFCAELVREVWFLEPWRRAAFCTMAAMGGYWIWRFSLCTYLKASASALTVRNRFTKWHIPFDDIADMTWLPGEGPLLTLRSGPVVRLDAYAGWPAGHLGRQAMTGPSRQVAAAPTTLRNRAAPDGRAEWPSCFSWVSGCVSKSSFGRLREAAGPHLIFTTTPHGATFRNRRGGSAPMGGGPEPAAPNRSHPALVRNPHSPHLKERTGLS